MKRSLTLHLILISAIFIGGCSKFETEDLVGTFWTGELTSTTFQGDEHIDISFDFEDGKANFTFLPYGEQYPETGVMLYSLSNDIFNISKANEMLNGDWKITGHEGKNMTLEKTGELETKTIDLKQRH